MNNPSSYANASLYVGDLIPDVNETQLFETFKQAGAVASIRVCRDAVTRRSLGYAYVNFHNAADANKAIELLNFKDIKGKPCRIMWSQRDPALRRTNAGNIFIKNLHKSIDNKALNDTFGQFGHILSAKVVTDEHGQSKGYGFVHFQTQEAADKAIELVNGKSMNGKICFVGVFVPRKEREKQQKSDPRWTNIYVKPLPKNIDDDGLRKMFSKYGEVTSAAIMFDEKKESRGFGFVNFAQHEEANKAIEDLNGKEYEGQMLFVGRAQKKGEREKDLKEMFAKIQRERVNKYQGVNLYIKNLDEGIDDDKLRAEFAASGAITSAKIMKDDKGRSKGFGFVCFASADEATKAVTEFNGRMIAGKPIYVALAQKKEQRRLQLEADFNRRNAGIRLQQQAQATGMTGSPIFPMFYPPNGRGFMYPPGPPQMGGRGRYPTRGMPFMPGFVVPQGPVPQGQQQVPQQGGGRGGRGHRGRGGHHQQHNQNAQGGQNSGFPMGIKYNPNVRNPGVPQAQQLQPSLSDATLPMTPERKNQIGEALYPLIEGALSPVQKQSLAGKITGMLLESLDLSELMQLLDSPDALSKKINEALDVLNAASQIPEAK